MKILAHKGLVGINKTCTPPEFRLSIGPFTTQEMSGLLIGAFGAGATYAWEPHPDSVLVPIIRYEGKLVSACSILRPCFIHQLAVEKKYRQLGLARELLYFSQQLLELPYLMAQVDETTTPEGHEFWKAMGFREIGV